MLLGVWALYSFYPHAGVDPAQGAPQSGVPAAWARTHLTGVDAAWHKNANVGHAVDQWLLNRLPRPTPFQFNPGGYATLNFLPSLVTMLFGLMVGELLRSPRPGAQKLRWLIGAGLGGIAAGLLWHLLGCPLVKRIWTPSWTLYSAGWCCLILSALYGVIDLRGWHRWSLPLVIVGMNSIAIYAMSMLLRPWTAKTLQTHLGEDIFNVFGAVYAPFVQATAVGLVFWLVCGWMYRRNIFLRI